MKMGVNGNPWMFLKIIKFLGQEDIPLDEILSFFHLLDSVPVKFSEHK